MTESIQIAYRLQHEEFSFSVDFTVPAKGITGVYGPSGAGKTTLLRCIAGLEPAARGRLVVAEDVWQDDQLNLCRPAHAREVAYVFQEPRLFAHLDVRRNLDFGAGRRTSGTAKIARAEVVDLLGIGHLLNRSPRALSGGEAQRVAIARALLRGPKLMLMDEPLAALDRARKDEVLPFFDRLHAELSLPIFYVSHDLDEICRLCDRLIVLDEGRLQAHGDLQTVLVDAAPPVLAGTECSSVVEGEVIGHDADEDITSLRFSGGEFFVAGYVGDPGRVLRLRIRANDVSLCRERPTSSSILNVLPVEIEELNEVIGDGGARMVLAKLSLGSDRLVARVTRRSRNAMQLRVGETLYAQIKSASIRSAPAGGTAHRDGLDP